MKDLLVGILASAVMCGTTGAKAQEQNFRTQIQALEWRNIGPFNGGRGTAVVGHPTDPMVFYFGHSSGGLWKTDDAGTYQPVAEVRFPQWLTNQAASLSSVLW